MEEERKTTALYGWHLGRSANMACFGGYRMPLWYPAGAKAEHLAVITAAGLFDTSHMAVLALRGQAVRDLLQRCCSKDLERCLGPKKTPLVAGRCTYGVFLDESAGVIDDAIVYQCGPTDYMLVVNASMGAPIAAHLRAQAGADGEILDLSDRVGKMDIQGPKAARILARVLREPAKVFDAMVYFSFKGGFDPAILPGAGAQLADGTPLMVSRTGYTGEFGFELFIAPEHTERLWTQLLAAGADDGLLPCGLAARDSLRAGAGLPLSHQDIGPWFFGHNPWTFVLPTTAPSGAFTKEFIGAAALRAGGDGRRTLAFAGFDPRKIPLGETSRVTDLEGRELGRILTCTTDMAIDRMDGRIVSLATPVEAGRPESFAPRGLCCGFVHLNTELPAGTIVLLTDGKRSLRVEIRDEIRPDRTARKPIHTFFSAPAKEAQP